MNVHLRPTITSEAEEMLEALAEELEIPPYRYEQAETSYKSLGNWLNREASSIRQYDPQVHVQGSFGLGTVTAPISEDEHYDIDAVSEFRKLTKRELSQQELKRLLGVEMRLYARAQSMNKPVVEHRRCWRLEYADGAQFHMDVTPGLLNGAEQLLLLKARGLDASLADTAIAITDIDHPFYAVVSHEWPRSNPRGYLKWFRGRMAAIFELRKRELIRKSLRAGTEPIPDYEVRTPLQSAIMILKRHRDIMFIARADERPISIILTTLAAHAYNGEDKISDALFAILTNMDRFIERAQDGTFVIANPSDPSENFADKWKKHPERAAAFFEWLGRAREDFSRAAVLSNKQLIADLLAKGVGSGTAERVKKRAAARLGAPAVLTSGLVRNEAQARSSAVRLKGDRRSA
ncbi:nucleotidyltransferase [Bradyrhizobium sp. Arg62]|uniref:nucleotidyltransferase domain-containing protein n=1 Tax=Bradyrhizobium brasilense TaxID=1419277 RepID=UPI001E59A040|nr:nucleotidyltransferase [Bradyrhizobium brasilense]MCC8948368.1 nucleotidyltransferase [Bradyrhizobium brasilense]